ncbi:MAG: anaerobic carbon-monoxide dehydrogenase catalytic subunit [Candidatus Bipolaricaulia bacterium]
MRDGKSKSVDRASLEVLARTEEEGLETVWDRWERQQPQCGFGKLGLCCRICNMGPCRIDPFGNGPQVGACGADADNIAARHLARMIATGTAAHGEHGRTVAEALLLASQDESSAYAIKDPLKLREVASLWGIEVRGREDREIAGEVAETALNEFGRQQGELPLALRAPKERVRKWRELGIMPRGVDREIAELLNRTLMGVDADYQNIVKQGLRTALANGWGGSMIATELQDILFGTPAPLRAKANLGVLEEDKVNIVVHGHEPTLSDVVVAAARDPELLELAEQKGAKGINITGICCTANEILMRHGIPIAGNFLQQELALATGAVELMLVDVQCVMPALATMAKCFHTQLLTTSPKARIPGVEHIDFEEAHALETAKELVRRGVENFANRDGSGACIPQETMDLVAGFTRESLFNILGGTYRATYRPLNDAIIDGRLRGVAGIVGCDNPNAIQDWTHIELAKELIKNDVLVAVTGCSAVANAKHGLLQPEAAYQLAGRGLQEICEAVGIPPVVHVGACVDNSRILTILTEMVREGGLGHDISDIPAAGAAPSWMSEKAISIGFYFVGSGVFTVFGKPHPILGSRNLTRLITEGLEELVGGRFAFEDDPVKAAWLMIEHIEKKREALKLRPAMYAEKTEREKKVAV